MNNIEHFFSRFLENRKLPPQAPKWKTVKYGEQDMKVMTYNKNKFGSIRDIEKSTVYIHPEAPMFIDIYINGERARFANIVYETDLYTALAAEYPYMRYIGTPYDRLDPPASFGQMSLLECQNAMNLVSLSRGLKPITDNYPAGRQSVKYTAHTHKEWWGGEIYLYGIEWGAMNLYGIQFDRDLTPNPNGEFKMFCKHSKSPNDPVWIEVFQKTRVKEDRFLFGNYKVTSEWEFISAILHCSPHTDKDKIPDNGHPDEEVIPSRTHLAQQLESETSVWVVPTHTSTQQHESDLMEPSVWAALDKLSNIAVHICRQAEIESIHPQ
jgi:hypothetical protein